MDFMGIGPLELILILILGFLFFGPEKLPDMAAKAGKFYRNFSRAANNLSKTLNEEVAISKELKEDKDIKSISESLKKTTDNLLEVPDSKTDKKSNG